MTIYSYTFSICNYISSKIRIPTRSVCILFLTQPRIIVNRRQISFRCQCTGNRLLGAKAADRPALIRLLVSTCRNMRRRGHLWLITKQSRHAANLTATRGSLAYRLYVAAVFLCYRCRCQGRTKTELLYISGHRVLIQAYFEPLKHSEKKHALCNQSSLSDSTFSFSSLLTAQHRDAFYNKKLSCCRDTARHCVM